MPNNNDKPVTKKDLITVLGDFFVTTIIPYFDKIEEHLDEHDKHFERIEKHLDEHDRRFDKLDGRLDRHGKQLEDHEERISALETPIP